MDNNLVFQTLNEINVNSKTEKKNGLTYLSWAYAWAEIKKLYPEARYNIVKGREGLPYVYDQSTGYMVFTEVTIGDVTHEMWLPVMDGANRAMKAVPYTYFVKGWINNVKTDVEKAVEAATMFDINKTIMRCLTKNLAMFGLGLYIYAGEDMPEVVAEAATVVPVEQPVVPAIADLIIDTDGWVKVASYITANKALGLEKILQQVQRKYKVKAAVKKAIEKLVNSEN
jgi:hypothetical protein